MYYSLNFNLDCSQYNRLKLDYNLDYKLNYCQDYRLDFNRDYIPDYSGFSLFLLKTKTRILMLIRRCFSFFIIGLVVEF